MGLIDTVFIIGILFCCLIFLFSYTKHRDEEFEEHNKFLKSQLEIMLKKKK